MGFAGMRHLFLALVFSSLTVVPIAPAGAAEFLRGDANSDGKFDISDPISTLLCLFSGTACSPCGDAADVQDDGRVDIADSIFGLNHLFAAGTGPRPPYPLPGFDPTPTDQFPCGDPPPSGSPGDVILSEIHYHPLSDPEEEFVELHNRSDHRVDLGGWRFSKGFDFIFPQVSIEPDAYLVVARNPAKIMAKYGISNVIDTGWAGQLDDGGETVRLRDPADNTINEVLYDDGGLWPGDADGYGPSLELIDLHGDNNASGAWQASDESSKSLWTPFQVTGAAASASSELHLLLISEGECLIDDLQVIVGGQNRLVNGSFESGMTGWLAQGTHRLSRVETGDAVQGTRALHLIATGRGDTASNRIECDLTTAVSGGQSVSIRGSARWLRGNRFLLLRLHGNAVAQTVMLNVPALSGTPGRPNGALRANRGPDITSVSHFPVLPTATQQVRVKALVTDVDGVASVDVHYRADAGAETVKSMTDDGLGGDQSPGDSVYSTMLPAQTNGRMVGFWVEAVDGAGAPARFPATAPSVRCLYRVGEPNPASQLDRYHVWMAPENVTALANAPKMSNELFDVTFVLNNTDIFYNARLRYRGSPFIRSGPPTDPVGGRYAYRIDFLEQQPLYGKTEINLDNLEPGRDPTIQREKTAYVLYEQLGLPWSQMDYVRLWINGNDHGVYADVFKADNDYVKTFWPEDAGGNFHKIDDYFEFDDSFGFSNRDARLTNYGTKKEEYRWNFEKRDDDRNDDFTPMYDLVRLMNTSTSSATVYEANIEQAIDVEQWARVLAVRKIIGDWDSFGYNRGKNMYMYRRPSDGRWVLIPWDMDFLLGNGDGPSSSLFGGIDPAVNTFLGYRKYTKLYLKAFRDLVDGPFQNSYLDPILDATYNMLRNETSVQSPSSIKSFIAARRNYVLTQLPADEMVILTNGGNDFSTSATSVTIEGDAPLEVERFRLNGATLAPTITGISKWSFTRSIPLGETTFLVEGLDASNALIGSDSITVLRVPPCVPSSVEPVMVGRTTVTLTIRGGGFAPGTVPSIKLTSASDEPGFNAFYAQSGGSFGDVNAAQTFLSNPASAVRTLTTTHLTVSRRTEGGGEIFPTQPFPSPWNTGDVSNLAARYTGYIHVPSAGNRTFGVHSDDGFRLRINNVVVAEYPPPRGPDTTLGTYNFPAAGTYFLQLDWYENAGGDIVQFFQESVGGARNLINSGSEATVTVDDPIIVDGTNVQVVDGETITANFDLTGVEPGPWSVVMTPVEGSVCRLEGGLTVE
jgi:hypothetical protein